METPKLEPLKEGKAEKIIEEDKRLKQDIEIRAREAAEKKHSPDMPTEEQIEEQRQKELEKVRKDLESAYGFGNTADPGDLEESGYGQKKDYKGLKE
tara:strand:+ start:124 stop:414 length:291 start_codon:yes stop_codon:yes gene_type:complete